MYKETHDGTLLICKTLCKSLKVHHTLGRCSSDCGAVLSERFPWMDRRSRAEVLAEVDYLARKSFMMKERSMFIAKNFAGVMKAFNRAYKRRWVATKGKAVRERRAVNRQVGKVFYLVSSHQKPQPAHKDVQGTILVDRFWRGAVPKEKVEAVGKYIKDHGIKTVQWALDGPTWLITRVNCRHYLMTMQPDEVLSMTVEALKKKYQRRPTGVHRPITDEERYED